MTPGQANPGFYRYTRPLLIAALLAPLVPVLTTTALYLVAAASGCSVAAHEPCRPGGTGSWLLVYLVLTGALA